MDSFTVSLWVVRLCFLALLYLFLLFVVRALWRDLRVAASTAARPLGTLVVVSSPDGQPPVGSSIGVDAVNTLGRDVNNSIVVEDDFASAEHALLTFRGRAWYIEDRGSTNGTWVNGQPVDGATPVGYGDEIQVGRVRFRLDRVASQ
ncbi:MAG: FHA domain-containing protein [Chloroflexota bacterium]|nr:FHA domain-containing protein [Chloroflexota bacterium]